MVTLREGRGAMVKMSVGSVCKTNEGGGDGPGVGGAAQGPGLGERGGRGEKGGMREKERWGPGFHVCGAEV